MKNRDSVAYDSRLPRPSPVRFLTTFGAWACFAVAIAAALAVAGFVFHWIVIGLVGMIGVFLAAVVASVIGTVLALASLRGAASWDNKLCAILNVFLCLLLLLTLAWLSWELNARNWKYGQ